MQDICLQGLTHICCTVLSFQDPSLKRPLFYILDAKKYNKNYIIEVNSWEVEVHRNPPPSEHLTVINISLTFTSEHKFFIITSSTTVTDLAEIRMF